MNAWLLTWEGTESKTLWDNDNTIVTVLSGRMSQKSVEVIADAIYTRCLWTASDLSYYANRKKKRDERFMIHRGINEGFCYGINPWIFARKVTDLVIKEDEDQGLESVRWTEYPYLILNSEGKIIEKEPACVKELTRTLIPLSAEIYPRKKQLDE